MKQGARQEMVKTIWKRSMWSQNPGHGGTNWAPRPMRIYLLKLLCYIDPQVMSPKLLLQ